MIVVYYIFWISLAICVLLGGYELARFLSGADIEEEV